MLTAIASVRMSDGHEEMVTARGQTLRMAFDNIQQAVLNMYMMYEPQSVEYERIDVVIINADRSSDDMRLQYDRPART